MKNHAGPILLLAVVLFFVGLGALAWAWSVVYTHTDWPTELNVAALVLWACTTGGWAAGRSS